MAGEPIEVEIKVSTAIIEKSVNREKSLVGEKAGRVLSKANRDKLQGVHDDLTEVHEHCSTRSGKAQVP